MENIVLYPKDILKFNNKQTWSTTGFLILCLFFMCLFNQVRAEGIETSLKLIAQSAFVNPEKNINHVVISLENSRHVWKHQRGTSQADILYEIVAEGHITRILSLFRDINQVNAEIGPVRSVRNYFMPFITDIQAMLLFCGASPSGYGRLEKETSILGCDEIANSDIFHRRDDIARPHNLFTNGNQIRSSLKTRNIQFTACESSVYETPLDQTFNTPDTSHNCDDLKKNSTEDEGKYLSIRYTATYCVTYKYNKKTKRYDRFINGKPHIDQNCGSHLSPSTVVIAITEARVMDKHGRLDIDIPSELPATIYSNGKVIQGSWSQPGGNSPLPLCDENDYPFIPPAGQIIFHLVTPMESVELSEQNLMVKKETNIEQFKRLWNGLISGASVRDATILALSNIYNEMTGKELVITEKFLESYVDNLSVRVQLVSALLASAKDVRKFSASILATLYKADGYEYVKKPVLEEKLLSNDRYVKNRALTELVDNLGVSGIN